VLGQQSCGGWTFITPVALFGVISVLYMMIGRGKTGGFTEAKSPNHRLAPMLWLPFQVALIVWVLSMVLRHELTILEIVIVRLSTGTVCGAIGIVFAHELIHRVSGLERRFIEALMVSVTYHHFCVEHVHGHHRKAGAKEDPATARLNESFYRFFPRATWGGWCRLGNSRLSTCAGLDADALTGAIGS